MRSPHRPGGEPRRAVAAAALLILCCFPPVGRAQDQANAARWEKAVAAFEEQDRDSPPPKQGIVFVGSSTIRLWDLAKSFPGLDAINRGFGGSQLADSVHFAQRLVLKHEPRTIVLYAGDNDLAAGKTPEQVFAHFQAFVKAVRDELPRTRIVYLSVKLSIRRWHLAEQIRRTNALIDGYCRKDERLRLVEVATPMLGDDGRPRPELFVKDGLHLSAKGYELWAALLRPQLAEPAANQPVRAAGLVLKWVRGDKEANFRRAEPLVREAARHGARLVCTTECFLDGYAIADKSIPLEQYRRLGEAIPAGPFYQRLAALAGELRIYLVAGMLEADGEARYNTAVLIGPDGGLIGKYRKQKLGHEGVRNTPGDTSAVFETPLGRVGLMICADRTDPAIVRRFRDNGAEVLICPSGGMFGPKTNDPIVQARSRETALPILFVHPAEFLVTGPSGAILDRTIFGDALLVSPQQVGGDQDKNRIFYFDLPVGRRPPREN
jgi:predicted amidohydrolase/lysophospholipase L1-like esterase